MELYEKDETGIRCVLEKLRLETKSIKEVSN